MLLRRTIIGSLLMAMACSYSGRLADGQTIADRPAQPLSRVDTLGLPPAEALALKRAIEQHDYIAAERMLLAELHKDSQSPRAGRLFNFLGAIYFLEHDDLNAAIAWKKSEQIAPLDASVQFSLAMAYVGMHRPDWALQVLHSLAVQHPHEAIYPYWLGRLEYDTQQYDAAIADYKQAIALAPAMPRAYDGLGLCYFYENQNALAIQNYERAIALGEKSSKPSAWPYLDLALTLEFVNQTAAAERNLREAIRLDPNLAQAHFHLGSLLQDSEPHDLAHMQDALQELNKAAQLDPNYAEPHFALARLYNVLGRKADAQAEVQIYRRIHDKANSASPPAPPPDGSRQ